MIIKNTSHQDLYISHSGEGPDVILLHGWGLHSAVWEDVITGLNADYRLHCIDLPGHGQSGLYADLSDLDAICSKLHKHVPSPAQWIGWSLGGLIAMAYALKYPGSIQRLILVASSPRFATSVDWQAAIHAATLKAFAAELEKDYHSTLSRFLALQVHSSANAQATLRRLRSLLLKHPTHQRALRAGLYLLNETDMRDLLPSLHCPTRLILGERDTLVPKECGKLILDQLSDADLTLIAGAGHAPFLSHPQQFNTALKRYLEEK